MNARKALRAAAVTAMMSTVLLPAGTASAAPPTNAITDVQVSCASDGSGGSYYQVAVAFTHRGPVEVRIYGLDGGNRYDSDHAWYRGSGAGTFTGALGALTPQVETHILTVDRPSNALTDVITPVVTNAPACSA